MYANLGLHDFIRNMLLGNRSECIHVEGVLRSLWVPGTLAHQSTTPFFVIVGLY